MRRLEQSAKNATMHEKTILHIDMDAFFAAIEQHDHPELKGLPVIVGSPPDKRGVVSTCSYEARKFGVHSAMPSCTAFKLCPHGIFLPVNMQRYQEVSEQIMEIFQCFTPLVEPLSCDEAFLDVTGAYSIFGDGPSIAHKIKAAVLNATGLTCSIGIAKNMFLAKIASDLNKPNGLTIVPSSEKAIVAFMATLPIKKMWGVGKKTQAILEAHHIHTIGDLQAATPQKLANWLGANTAASFRQLAFGVDDRLLTTENTEKSISNEITFEQDLRDIATIEAALIDLVDKVGCRLRRSEYYAATAQIKIRWDDFTTITRQKKLSPPCCDDITLRETALALWRHEKIQKAVRLVGFGVSNLQADLPTAPLDLFPSADQQSSRKREQLSRTVDNIRASFGGKSIRRASKISASEKADLTTQN